MLGLRLISDWEQMYGEARWLLGSDAPAFLGRIGGSDTDMVVDYLQGQLAGEGPDALMERLRRHLTIVKRYNGYYDKSRSDQKLQAYCEELIRCYRNLTHASVCGGKWLGHYFKENIEAQYWQDVGDLEGAYDWLLELSLETSTLSLMPYPFVEKMFQHKWSLFNAFTRALRGKTVLVVSPFAKSIEANFANRSRFFRGHKYPEFELKTLNTPITYDGLPDDCYPHDDWFQTAAALIDQASKTDFDIALLSCGSYAMPLGDHIAAGLGRKAVYVGGILQLYFGVMGRRYENPFFLNQIRPQYFVRAEEEAERYLKHVTVAPNAPKEGFGAYF